MIIEEIIPEFKTLWNKLFGWTGLFNKRLGRHIRFDERSRNYRVILDGHPVELCDKMWERKLPALQQGSVGSCHDSETEVLTDDGWKLWTEIVGDEHLASVCPVTRNVIFERPTRLFKVDFDGELICGNTSTIDFAVTPDHQMLVRKWSQAQGTLEESYSFISAANLGWYSGLMNRVVWGGNQSSDLDEYIIPGDPHGKHKPLRENMHIPIALWMQFLGIYLAEGTVLSEPGVYKIQLAASKAREKDYIRQLLRDMGIHSFEGSDRFTFENKRVYTAMCDLGLKGVKAPQKFVPKFVFQQSAENIRQFLHGHFIGDGSTNKGRRAHYTSSKRLANDLQTLIFLSGDESGISSRLPRCSTMRDGRIVIGRYPEYRVSVRQSKGLSIERKHCISRRQYSGPVYCAEMPTHHTLVTRRNGKILISGNCTGNAVVGLLATRPNDVDGIADNTEFSEGLAVDLYSLATELDQFTGTYPPDDTGSSVLSAMKAAKEFLLIEEYRWCFGLEDVLRTLSYVGPVAIGVNWYAGFDKPTSKGLIKISGSVRGGHAVELLGIDVRKKIVWGINSWGKWWGKCGRFCISFADLDRLLKERGEAATVAR